MSKKHSRRRPHPCTPLHKVERGRGRGITNHNHETTETLTYSVPLFTSYNKEILNTLFIAKRAGNYYLRKLFSKETVESLSLRSLPAYKILEHKVSNPQVYIPSRLNRGILEVAGRILRQQGDRESVFSALLCAVRCASDAFHSSKSDPTNWDFNLLLSSKNLYEKSQYIENIKAQTENYISKNGKFPASYFAMTKTPRLSRGIISYAPDDGQALFFSTSQEAMKVFMKVAKTTQPKQGKDWEWIDFEIPLFPEISVSDVVCVGLIQDDSETHYHLDEHKAHKDFASFDLRCGIVHEKLVPILDIKVKVSSKEQKETGNFLVVDWGIRKLVTICVFNEKGEQISPPFFLKWNPLQRKLYRIRQQIDCLKSKRDKLPKKSTQGRWYNKEIAKNWNKFRQIQKQLSHLASNCIVEIAKAFDCDKIYVEWLKSLKSDSFSRNLNWTINSTVRQAIYDKVSYKASQAGIKFCRPLPAGHTSQFCPKCGKKGYHVKAPNRLKEKIKSGSWFYCPHCHYNADRDYVATQNLARRALFGNCFQSKTFAYTTKVISDKLFRQSIEENSKLRHCLNGWKNSVSIRPLIEDRKNTVFLKPVIFGAGTLRL